MLNFRFSRIKHVKSLYKPLVLCPNLGTVNHEGKCNIYIFHIWNWHKQELYLGKYSTTLTKKLRRWCSDNLICWILLNLRGSVVSFQSSYFLWILCIQDVDAFLINPILSPRWPTWLKLVHFSFMSLKSHMYKCPSLCHGILADSTLCHCFKLMCSLSLSLFSYDVFSY